VHALDKDVTKDDIIRSDIILHAHTHKAELRLDDGMLYINPGHLKGPIDKNSPPTFGLLDIQDKEVKVALFNLEFKVIQEKALLRSENGLYKV